MNFLQAWTRKSVFLLMWFFVVYYIVMFLWGAGFLALLIYAFTDQEDDKAIAQLSYAYNVHISNLSLIIGFFFSAVIIGVKDNIQARVLDFESNMKIITQMLPKIAAVSEHSTSTLYHRSDVRRKLYQLVNVILIAEGMPELCQAAHTEDRDDALLHPSSGSLRVGQDEMRVYYVLADLQAMLATVAAETGETETSKTVGAHSEIRGIMFSKLMDHITQLENRYVTLPKHHHLWSYRQALYFVDWFARFVAYAYIAVRPVQLLPLAIRSVHDIFIHAAWYALVGCVLLVFAILNSWYELVYNGHAATWIDTVIMLTCTPIRPQRPAVMLRAGDDNQTAWYKFARRFELADDVCTKVNAAIQRMLPT